jgi:hypothetical protein
MMIYWGLISVDFSLTPVAYRADLRANRLEDWSYDATDHPGHLLIRGSADIARHLARGWPRLGSAKPILGQSHWTYGLRVDFQWDPELEDFLNLLKKAHVLRVSPTGSVSGAMVLDFYKRVSTADEGRLVHSTIGRLVSHAKGYEPGDMEGSRQILSGHLRDVAAKHLWFRRATRVLPVPGHKGASNSELSHRIAETLRDNLGLEIVRVDLRDGPREPAKNMTPYRRAALKNGFLVYGDLLDETVLVVDDLYHTGSSMGGVANAARRAGATTVLGLAAARVFRH